MTTALEYIAIALLLLLWIAADAAQDTITFHYEQSWFLPNAHPRRYFDPAISWRNKYEDGDPDKGPRFFGSTTFLVWLTDFWHLLKFCKMLFLWAVVALLGCSVWIFIIGVVVHGLVFEICLKLLERKY